MPGPRESLTRESGERAMEQSGYHETGTEVDAFSSFRRNLLIGRETGWFAYFGTGKVASAHSLSKALP